GNNTQIDVYWPEPNVVDDQDEIISLSSNYNSGTLFSSGVYNITYNATDSFGHHSFCYITVYVINSKKDSVDICYSNSFVVYSEFNRTYGEIELTLYEISLVKTISGQVYS